MSTAAIGLSTSLLILAVVMAAVPVALIGAEPPTRIRDLEKGLVSSFIVLIVGTIIINGFHGLGLFGLIHLAYLLVVVTIPLILGAWFLFSLRLGRRRIDTVFGVVAGLIAVLGLYATHVEPRWLRVDEAVLDAAIAAPLRIGVVADLQTPNVGAHEREAIAELLSRRPDMVLIPGDWYQGTPEQLEANRGDFVDLLRQLVDNTQLVAITTGDSDHTMSLEAIAAEAGALFIDDRVLAFELNGVPVRLAGVRVLANGPDRDNTLVALTEQTDALSILVAHRPDVVYELPGGADVDLIVSGHTHGGQVSIPFFGPPVTFSDVPRDLAAGGLGIVNNVPLYVSAGVGIERLEAPQVRFGVRPEVGIIDIRPR